jgi:hypothetical protein
MKTFLITGGSSGIGLHTALQLAQPDHHLVLIARSETKLRAVSDELEQAGAGTVTTLVIDLTAKRAIQDVQTSLAEKEIQIDVLINNAGFGDFADFADADPAVLQDMIDLNISAVTQLTHALLPEITSREGRIVFIASVAGFMPGPQMAVYFATKAYVRSFAFALREELRESPVGVTIVSPGPVDTNFADRANAQHTEMFLQAMPVDAVGALVALAATTPRPLPEYVTTLQHRLSATFGKLLPWNWAAKIVARVQR